MVKVIESVLTDDDIIFYTELVKTDMVEYNPIYNRTTTRNFYNRFFVENSEIKKSLTEKLISNKILNNELLVSEIWINKITPDSNKNDEFHFDENDVSIIIYLNDEFTGGEFEYIENTNSYKIQPKKGLTLRLDNKVKHRVLPIADGVRYSLVIFIKKKKTLL